jgi:hypothetical protein
MSRARLFLSMVASPQIHAPLNQAARIQELFGSPPAQAVGYQCAGPRRSLPQHHVDDA